MNAADEAGTTAAPGRKRRTGSEVFLIFPLIALLNFAASPLFSIWLSRTVPVSLDFSERIEVELAGSPLYVEGLSTLTVPVEELSSWAVGQFIAAKVVWIVGLFVATWFAARAVSELTKGQQFSDRMSRSLAGLSWTLVAVGPLYALAQVPADNLVIRDLGLRDMGVDNGVTMMLVYLWLGGAILVEILRRAVKRGRAVQDELDGLI
jgi:hypothetical protein